MGELFCDHSSAFIFKRSFFILAGNKDSHNSLDEFEFWPDPNTDNEVSYHWASEKLMYNDVTTLDP